MKVVNAPIILSESMFDIESRKCECVRNLIRSFMDHEYECRYTKFQASDYGSVRSQDRYILLASKIGIPKLPGITVSSFIAH